MPFMDYPPPAQYQLAQAGIPADAQQIDVSRYAPPTAATITLKITIQPTTGSLRIYTPGTAQPVQFDGPVSTKEVPLNGSFLFLLPGSDARTWNVEVQGHSEKP